MDEQVRGVDVEQAILTLRLVDPLLRALGTKVLAILTLAMTFVLYCWAMRLQSPLAFAIAGSFGAFVLLPVLFIGWKGKGT
jgi:hypothetical protein